MSIYDWDLLQYLSASPTGDYLSIYSTFDLAGNTSVYNTNLWGGGGINVDFTCCGHRITPSSTFYCKLVAITPRHAIRTEHSAVASDIGQVYGWIARDGTLVQRTIIDNYPYALGPGNVNINFQIVYLDSDLPASITPVKLFGDTAYPLASEPPVVRTNQFNQAMLANGYETSGLIPNILFFQPATTPLSIYWGAWISGDSGSPAFFVNGGNLIYTTSAVTPSQGPNTKFSTTALLAACATLDARNANTGYVPGIWNPSLYRAARARRRLVEAA